MMELEHPGVTVACVDVQVGERFLLPLRVRHHRPELEHQERTPVVTHPTLAKDDRAARRAELDCSGDHRK
jgi:hypothetical protein